MCKEALVFSRVSWSRTVLLRMYWIITVDFNLASESCWNKVKKYRNWKLKVVSSLGLSFTWCYIVFSDLFYDPIWILVKYLKAHLAVITLYTCSFIKCYPDSLSLPTFSVIYMSIVLVIKIINSRESHPTPTGIFPATKSQKKFKRSPFWLWQIFEERNFSVCVKPLCLHVAQDWFELVVAGMVVREYFRFEKK